MFRFAASRITALPKHSRSNSEHYNGALSQLRSLTSSVDSQAVAQPSTSGRTHHWLDSIKPSAYCHLGRPKALFLDAAGTFLIPSERVTDVYLRYGRAHGVKLTEKQVLARFRAAYNEPWGASTRYAGDARDFWQIIVQKSLDCNDKGLFEDIYRYYEHREAWTVPPGLVEALTCIREAGIPICVVSNFDTRLRPLLAEMNIAHLFDHVIVSAEVGAEKPSPVIFEAACAVCGVDPSKDLVIHVGDDRRNDVWGARDSGLCAWLWGIDVRSFKEIADRVVSGNTAL